ncbi:adenosylcobinamide-phosphate synthase CbiB [uncultured Tateyamaria sp.]|uniref:adenosylcobinamide-phosphate synthase CbiB n=1 Tax=uncultured Tateyamaria sp. TaxID=455651 RepID=UPI00262C7451|nr:adenosylcobinamide-phosphate synthase CbiB [uncultured Tateyamaria sp.]
MSLFLLALAMILDAVAGEPRWLWSRAPHPAIIMGKAVGALDKALNAGSGRRIKGVLAVLLLVICAGLTGWVISLFGPVAEIIAAAILLAQKSLVDHVRAVSDGLRQSDEAGRAAVAMIVSRDVSQSTPSDTARAAIESLSENFSDGVIAPAFWFLIGGLPGIMIYKAVNTADSMIGYLTPRHAAFGWAAARLDDLLNWVPARLSAGLIAAMGDVMGTWAAVVVDAKGHRSPNAGWPEAAMARALNIALAGPRSYHGTVQPLAWVNGSARRDLTPADIDAAVAMVWKAWGLVLGLVLVTGGISWVF